MLASILINNYNYGRFLRDAIDSALNQTYPHVEVIVVDDGSTDDSREIIASYGDRIIPVLKENGGQASAFNAGFVASKGDVICLLDADDMFKPAKVQSVVRYLVDNAVVHDDVLVYHDLEIIDRDGVMISERRQPPIPRWEGNFYDFARKYRYVPYVASFPSGSSITRSLAARIFPLPEGFPTGGDNPLIRAAGLLGEIKYLDESLSRYRVHGDNWFYGRWGYKPREFYELEEEFLNRKLVEANKQPVLRVFDSMSVRGYYRSKDCYGDLLRLVLVVPLHHLNPRTCKFAVETVAMVVADTVPQYGRRIFERLREARQQC